MATSDKKIDEVRHGKHFKRVHIVYAKRDSKTQDFFYIDQVKVDEQTFWASYHGEAKP